MFLFSTARHKPLRGFHEWVGMYERALLAQSCPTSKSFAQLQEVQETGTEDLARWKLTTWQVFL